MSIRKVILLLGVLGLSTACTSMRAPSESDPLEGFNRSVDGFNQVVDKAVVKPLARTRLAAKAYPPFPLEAGLLNLIDRQS